MDVRSSPVGRWRRGPGGVAVKSCAERMHTRVLGVVVIYLPTAAMSLTHFNYAFLGLIGFRTNLQTVRCLRLSTRSVVVIDGLIGRWCRVNEQLKFL